MHKLVVVLFVGVTFALDLVVANNSIEKENLRRHASQAPFYDIVPILECVDQYNKAYFNYQNNEGTTVSIAFSDFNNLSPLNVAPITAFSNGSGPSFPFSTTVSLAGFENATFNWDLQEYYLPFIISSEVACPPKFNVTLRFKFTYSSAYSFPSAQKIVEIFAGLAGISETRFVVLSSVYVGPMSKKRGDLDAFQVIELELNDGNVNASDPTAADVIRDFVENQKQNELNQQVDALYPPASNLTIFEPKSDEPQVVIGQIRPPMAPVAVSEPVSAPTSSPLSAPTASPVSTPKSRGLSSAASLCISTVVAVVAIVLQL